MYKEENRNFPWQHNQDKELQKKFYDLHHKIVDEIIAFCKENDIVIDEFHIGADGIQGSIEFGKWCPCTDSSFTMDRDITTELGKPRSDISKEEYKEWEVTRKHFIQSL